MLLFVSPRSRGRKLGQKKLVRAARLFPSFAPVPPRFTCLLVVRLVRVLASNPCIVPNAAKSGFT